MRFGRLEVLHPIDKSLWRGRNAEWACECECGEIVFVHSGDLVSGNNRSCGCLRRGRRVENLRRASRTYSSWRGMKDRCLNPNSVSYPLYGGRGITICDEWITFDGFLADMGERPEGMSLDRIDPDGNYEPANCRWATPQQQVDNRRMARAKSLTRA